MEQKFIPFEVIEKFMTDILKNAGIPGDDASIVCDVLIKADKFGFDSHGVNRLKTIYLDRIADGTLNPITNFEIVKEGPATAVIDGHNGMGQVIAFKAMKLAIENVRKTVTGL